MNLNIGGGSFSYPDWINLDASTGFKFTPDCVFPISSATVIYSSHCLEHLDDETVDRVLSESRRVGESLVLKLPDFEDVIERWWEDDHAYFKQWGFEKIAHMWTCDDIDSRASMIFCGYWNDAYGDEFCGKRMPYAPGAYHGPTRTLHCLDASPHEIAAHMKSAAPAGAHFNHQNAWSRQELTDLLKRHGFVVDSMDAEEICQLPIPTIKDLRGISMYVLARVP